MKEPLPNHWDLGSGGEKYKILKLRYISLNLRYILYMYLMYLTSETQKALPIHVSLTRWIFPPPKLCVKYKVNVVFYEQFISPKLIL